MPTPTIAKTNKEDLSASHRKAGSIAVFKNLYPVVLINLPGSLSLKDGNANSKIFSCIGRRGPE